MRHDFYAREWRKIGAQAGWLCANPQCNAATIAGKSGPSDEGFQTLGRAAHITAASKTGPRYDQSLSEKERRSAGNGIWLCNVCANTVDADKDGYPTEKLHEWKKLAKERSIQAALRYSPKSAEKPAAPPDGLLAKVVAASRDDIATFKSGPRWPLHPVKLQLHFFEKDTAQTFDADGLAGVTQIFDDLVLVAPPGTGKSTSLIQIAEAVIETRGVPAILVRLNDWAAQGRSIFEVATTRHAFRECSVADLQTLAEKGELCIALDGWNELDPSGENRARAEIERLRSEYPEVSIILSTRRQALPSPLTGQVVELDLLSEAQQMEIASALKGEEGKKLVDQAWRTPGVRDLVAIPLYLNALLENAAGGKLPTTRAKVLAIFIQQHEQQAANAAALRKELQDQHDAILAALAAEATSRSVTALRQVFALVAVSRARAAVTQAGLACDLPPALQMIDTLVAHHCLVRADGAGTPVSFEHQQIQEYYASRVVVDVMREAKSEPAAAARLRTEFLNHYTWEEPILFACETLALEGSEGAQAVASAILAALEIDPLLAAEMIARSSEEVWALISDRVQRFVSRWHMADKIDRAYRFMLISGRPEFAPFIWPLVSSSDHQAQAAALFAVQRIRVDSLGEGAAQKIAKLDEDPRKHLLSDIARHGDFEGLTLAAEIAANDPSLEVQLEVVQSFASRRADRFIDKVVEGASDAFWEALAKAGYPQRLTTPEHDARLQKARAERAKQAQTPNDRLIELFDTDDGTGVHLDEMIELIANPDFSFEHAYHFGLLARRYPADVAAVLIRRIEAGLAVPHGTPEMLRIVQGTADSDAICALAVDPSLPGYATTTSAVSIIAGPKAIAATFDALIETDNKVEAAGKYDKELSDYEHRLEGQLSKAKPRLVVDAVVERSKGQDARGIGLLSGVIASLGGPPDDGERQPLDDLGDIVVVLKMWGEQLLADDTTPRHVFDRLARAIGRVASKELLPLATAGLQWEIEHRAAALEARRKNPGSQNDGAMFYAHNYRMALVEIGGEEVEELFKGYLGDEEFSKEAAIGLRQLWAKRADAPVPNPFRGPRFSWAAAARKRRAEGKDAIEIDPSAKAILDAIPKWITEGTSDREKGRAFELASVAVSMPHRGDAHFCDPLLAIPGFRRGKLALVRAMIDAGYVVPAELIVAGMEAVLEDAKTQAWITQQQHSEFKEWIELFGASDNPEAALNEIPRLKEHEQRPWELRGLLSGLKQFPSPGAERTLAALVARDPSFHKEHDWRAAMLAQGSTAALQAVIAGAIELNGQGGDLWSAGRDIAGLVAGHLEVRPDLNELLRTTKDERTLSLLQRVVAEAPDEEALFILIDRYQEKGWRYRRGIHEVVRKLALGQKPRDPNVGSYEIFGVPLIETRRKLFAMTAADDPRRELAAACLADIDDLRDEYGQVPEEPRHPDIEAGRPWPLAVD